jgi:putative hydrolase of HD superfamily
MKNLEKFLNYISDLKLTVRTGWKMRQIEKGETIGSHSFSVSLLAWIFSNERGLNSNKVIKLALVHELLEGIIGDIPAFTEKHKHKRKLEEKALPELEKILPKEIKDEIISLVKELIEGKTIESKIVIQADRLDTLFQLYFYKKRKLGKLTKSDFQSFYSYAKEVCKDGFSKEFLEFMKEKFKEEFS